MFHVKHMKNYNNFYCTAKDRLVTGDLFSVYFNNDRTLGKTKINPEEDMYRFYKSDSYHSHQEKTKTFTDLLYFMTRSFMMYFKYNIIKSKIRKGKLLDYGCGNGDFLKYVSKKKINVTGIEKSLISQKTCRSKGLKVYSSLKKIDQENYNIISLWHVLEHVPNPSKCIEALSKFLSKEGAFVIALPNIQSYDSQLFKEEWAGLDVPRHLWHFTPKGLIDLLKKQNFILLKKRPLYIDAYYISLLSARRKKMMFPWIMAFLIGTISNIFGFFNGNYSSSVFVFENNN